MSADAFIAELARDTRIRTWTILPFSILGIIGGAVGGLAYAFGALPWEGTTGARNPAALIFFVAPFAICFAIGQLLYRIARR